MKNSARIIASLFLGLWALPLLFTLIFNLQRQAIRYRMKEKLESGSLQTVVIPENEVIWMDKHEIWVNEHMFDIRTKKLENGKYTFTGMYDEEETKLVKQNEKSTEQNQDDDKMLAQVFQCLQHLFYESAEAPFALFTNSPHNTILISKPVSIYSPILIPPPQVHALTV